MAALSAVIITYNEEKNIGRCLDSIKDICDEIIVIDSYSTDGTEKICKGIGNVRFIKQEWLGYAGSKNTGNQLAHNKWILSMDADEALSKELAKSILSVKSKLNNSFYSFNRLTNYCGTWIKHSGWYPDTKVRIFNSDKAHWEGLIHEILVYDKSIPVKKLKGDLLHYSYYSIKEHEQQIQKYSALAAEELKSRGKKSNFIIELFSPITKFFETYLFKKAFLDGKAGYTISIMTARATKLKYRKLRNLWK